MDELATIRTAYRNPDPTDRMGRTIGELDWLTELHELLYGEHKYNSAV
jgi:hypothetical protein